MIARGGPRTREPLLHGADAARALDIAQHIFTAAWARLANDPNPPESISRYGGAALVAESLARAGRADERTLRTALREALVFAPDRLSLYDGAGGLLVVLDAADPDHESFAAVRARLRDALAASLRDAQLTDPADPSCYDIIAGLAGRAIALGPEEPGVQRALRAYAKAFAQDVELRLAADPSDFSATVNLSVSHGVAGMLAALNAALSHDRELGRRYVEMLLESSHVVGGERRWGAVWRRDERPTARRAWCYQTVGIAAVLDDRARLDDDDDLHRLAAGALRAVLDEPAEERWDAALCHGRSGVAALAWRFADDPRLQRHAELLAHSVLGEFDPGAPLGYRTFDPRADALGDRLSFLDGALGIAQFLVDAATAQERRWLALFGLLPD